MSPERKPYTKRVRRKQPQSTPLTTGASNSTGVTAITCPKCGGTIQAPNGTNKCFCMFCGTQLVIDDGSRTVTYRTIDEARIREAEIEEALELKKLEIEERRRPGRLKLMAILAITGILMIVIGEFAGHASGDQNSPWYMLAMLGFFPIIAITFLWASMHKKD